MSYDLCVGVTPPIFGFEISDVDFQNQLVEVYKWYCTFLTKFQIYPSPFSQRFLFFIRMVTILSSMMGTFFGGWIHRKLKLQEKGAAAIVLLGAFLVVIFTGLFRNYYA